MDPSKPLGRELWLMALNDGKGDYPPQRYTNALPQSKKSSGEHFKNTLRRAGGVRQHANHSGRTALSKKRSLTNLSPRSPGVRERAFLSTPIQLRREVLCSSPCPINSVNGGGSAAAGSGILKSPSSDRKSYKTPEEYFDEVIELKKRIVHLSGEYEFLKCKFRKSEDANKKKNKMLDSLLENKNENVFGGIRPDVATYNLKQKIFKLESQLREKDANFLQLKNDIKYTKMEEMKIQLETLYLEVLRLRSSGSAELQYAAEELGKQQDKANEDSMKHDALVKAVKKLNEDKTQLNSENKHLREELDAILTKKSGKKKKDIHGSLSSLRRQSDSEEKSSRGGSRKGPKEDANAVEDKTEVESKIILEGDLRERLETLDKRESELVDEVNALNKKISRLEEDRDLYKKKYTDKCEEVKELNAEISRLKSGKLSPTETAKRRENGLTTRKGNEDAGLSDKQIKRLNQENEQITLIQSAIKGFLHREEILRKNKEEKRNKSKKSSSTLPKGKKKYADNNSLSADDDDDNSMNIYSNSNRNHHRRGKQDEQQRPRSSRQSNRKKSKDELLASDEEDDKDENNHDDDDETEENEKDRSNSLSKSFGYRRKQKPDETDYFSRSPRSSSLRKKNKFQSDDENDSNIYDELNFPGTSGSNRKERQQNDFDRSKPTRSSRTSTVTKKGKADKRKSDEEDDKVNTYSGLYGRRSTSSRSSLREAMRLS